MSRKGGGLYGVTDFCVKRKGKRLASLASDIHDNLVIHRAVGTSKMQCGVSIGAAVDDFMFCRTTRLGRFHVGVCRRGEERLLAVPGEGILIFPFPPLPRLPHPGLRRPNPIALCEGDRSVSPTSRGPVRSPGD